MICDCVRINGPMTAYERIYMHIHSYIYGSQSLPFVPFHQVGGGEDLILEPSA